MAFLLRVELPDVPGSLGALATALGSAKADIEAIEIVEHRADGTAVDDVLLELPHDVLPEALITACHRLDGVKVQWISRYNAGASLSMDLEAVESFTSEPDRAIEQLVSVIPASSRPRACSKTGLRMTSCSIRSTGSSSRGPTSPPRRWLPA